MSIFKSTSFDSFIGKGVKIGPSYLHIPAGETLILDADVELKCLSRVLGDATDKDLDKKNVKTTVKFGGNAAIEFVCITNVIVTGVLKAKTLRVEGTLSVKSGARVEAEEILYRELNIEAGAIIQAQMNHLDYSSKGELGITTQDPAHPV